MRLLALVAMLATWLLLPASSARAADAIPRENQFVTVERTVRDILVEPGSERVEEITIKNQTTRPVVIDATAQDLGIRSGGDRSLEIDGAGSQERGAGGWLTPEAAKLRIPALEERTMRVRVRVPADAGPGTWQALVLLLVTPEAGEGVVALQEETSVTMLLQVAGDAKRDLRVSLRPEDRAHWRGGEAVWTVTVANEGDVHESFGGRVVVDALLAGSRSMQLQTGILLPGERRDLRVRVQLREAPDRVRARAEVTTRARAGGDTEPTDTELTATAQSVFVLPWWIPLVVLAAVVIIVLRVRRTRSSDDDVDFDSES